MTVNDLIRAGGGLAEDAYGGEADLARYKIQDGQTRRTEVLKVGREPAARRGNAVAAMEKSTVGVVEGTKLSDAAGQALSEIQKVSRDLADLIAKITTQTQMQSASVSDVTKGMQGILRITEETTEGTKQTNVSIGQLTRLAAELRSSVAGFKV